MPKVKWKCPQCRRNFEVNEGREPLLCPDCASEQPVSRTPVLPRTKTGELPGYSGASHRAARTTDSNSYGLTLICATITQLMLIVAVPLLLWGAVNNWSTNQGLSILMIGAALQAPFIYALAGGVQAVVDLATKD